MLVLTLACVDLRRFVCDGGNGGSYRNVATVAREHMCDDGKFHCDISGLLPGREYRVLAIARTRFKPCHGDACASACVGGHERTRVQESGCGCVSACMWHDRRR